MTQFPTKREDIEQLIHAINPTKYASSRNYINGAVTYLSPYISRGIISTRMVFDYLKSKQHTWHEVEKLIQELAWRDYFQHMWNRLGERINEDIKQPQYPIRNQQVPLGLIHTETGVLGIDQGILNLMNSGYMHNHQRMYTASLACNVAHCHWLEPARWMYYYLLDADWASNACSWQWVAGSFSSKKYYANQENINRYCGTEQFGTYLDISYEELPNISIPGQLTKCDLPELRTKLSPTSINHPINKDLPTLLYNWYNLDYNWHVNLEANRILILEPKIFEKYPISEKSMQFMLEISKNIPNLNIFCGSFDELKKEFGLSSFIYKQHPLNDYEGIEEQRQYLTERPTKNFNSFFGFWKSIEQQLRDEFSS